METKQQPYLTPEQVHQLNEKHGWFQFGDAQSDVSKAFAQDAIDMHERVRAAAPDLLEALRELDECYCEAGQELSREDRARHRQTLIKARAAIAKATGSAA
jgi:hypothetical protein